MLRSFSINILMKHALAVLSLLLLLSCASTPPMSSIPSTGTTYVTASWYGPQFNGRPTSSGERYDMHGLTAAHKTMKFGTQLRVTNPDNNKSVDIIVNDRGPFIPGRDLDLSYGAAKAIDFDKKGVGRLKVEYLGRDMRYAKRIAFTPSKATVHGGVTIQLGSFANEAYAERLKDGLEIKYKDVYITTVSLNGIEYYRVRVGKFDTYEGAYSFAEKLADEGYNTFITSID